MPSIMNSLKQVKRSIQQVNTSKFQVQADAQIHTKTKHKCYNVEQHTLKMKNKATAFLIQV